MTPAKARRRALVTRYRKPLTSEEEAIARADTGFVKVRAFYCRNSDRVNALALTLGVPYATALGALTILWGWALEFCIDGDLRTYDNRAIASCLNGSGVEIDPDAFVRGLIDARILEETPYFRITDWWSVACETISRRLKFKSPYQLAKVRKAYEALTAKEIEEVAVRETKILDRDLVANKVADIAESIGLPSPKREIIDDVMGVDRLPPNASAMFIFAMDKLYEANTGHKMIHAKSEFSALFKLLREAGVEAVAMKARYMAIACKRKSLWWTKGWQDFSVWNLIKRYNELLPPSNPDAEKEMEFLQKFKFYMEERGRERSISTL